MNILELEEGLRNLIATQPAVMSGENSKVINSIKSIIESHKTFLYSIEEYPENDILKIGLMNESSRLEINLTSYVCQILQERGINIMLYVPKYAAIYDKQISKYVDNVVEPIVEEVVPEIEPIEAVEEKNEKFIVVDKNENIKNEEKIIEKQTEIINQKSQEKQPGQIKTQAKGRDYLMDLLKK